MSNATDTTSPANDGARSAPAEAPRRPSWRDAWQIPALLAAVAGLAGAFVFLRAQEVQDDFEGAIAQAEKLVANGEFAQADAVLDTVLAPNLARAPEGFLARYQAVRADRAFAELGPSMSDRDQLAKTIAAYRLAMDSGWTLTPNQAGHYGRCLLEAGEEKDAFDAVRELGGATQGEIRRRALEGLLDGDLSAERRLAELEAYRADPTLPPADHAWAAARAARVRLAMGRAADAADRLLLDLGRIAALASIGGTEPPAPEAYGELHGLLGEALRREGRLDDARTELERAEALVRVGTRVEGEVAIALGRTLLALEAYEDAESVLERAVLAEHEAPLDAEALFARGEVRARLGKTAASIADFRLLKARLHEDDAPAAMIDAVESALFAEARLLLVDDRPAEALAFAEIASELRRDTGASAESLLLVATAARAEADRLRGTVAGAPSIDPEDRAAINRLLRRAADAFASHATTPDARAGVSGDVLESRWLAADSYDLAGWSEPALANFRAFLDTVEPDDLRRAEAYRRMASLHHAEGAFDAASEGYERAIAIAPNGPEAVRSVVPLARALAAAGRTADALSVLGRVLDGEFGLKPSANEYLEALDAAARLSFDRGEFVRAAEHLRELEARAPGHERIGEFAFRLGESLAEIARAARAEAETADLAVARRAQFRQDADDRLAEARRAFDRAIVALEARGAALAEVGGLDGLARDMLRDAHLGRAHAAFDLGLLEDAIGLYEAVDRKYPEHAVSMIALIQIVNACDRLGDATRAETAHRRAQLRLAQLPDDAFLTGGGILARESWQTWLRNHPAGGARVAAGGASDEGGER
ncbi:MAG: hypothetical protein RI967_1199 [Planctomycetota bacterium]